MDSIIFDMDGTLWDSAENVAKAWNEAVGREMFTERDIKSVMGLTMTAIAKRLFPNETEEKRQEFLDRCCECENKYLRAHGGKLFPNTESTLKKLSERYRLFIVSNCQAGYIEAFWEYYKLGGLFEDKLCWGDNRLEKSENIRLIIEKNGLRDALYVGDTQGDCDSAYKAGARFAHAAYGFGTADRCDYRLNDISELLTMIGQSV
ncbi:MAG: HAD family hydrolase [Oscillospiraceae bacterium]|nr:HAD family hydrolase [Oscillospiraceae bacterium]